MITSDVQSNQKTDAGRLFNEWADEFSEKLFVILKVYFDESESFDGDGKSKIIVVGGYIALKDEWRKFTDEWRAVLDKNGIKNFHFHQFHAKTDDENNPYRNWTDDERDEFFYDLAMVLSERLIPVGGSYDTKRHQELSNTNNPIDSVFKRFFDDLQVAATEHWPQFTGGDFENKILFIYDKTTNPKWLLPLHNNHRMKSDEDSRFGGLSFENDEDPRHLGLQAADFYCGIFRQASERQYATKQLMDYRIIDIIITRHLREQNHKWSLTAINPAKFRLMIHYLREDSKRQKQEWSKQGIKQVYYPLKHCPLAKDFMKEKDP
jgi:Protein of unknown function (DUF3800)